MYRKNMATNNPDSLDTNCLLRWLLLDVPAQAQLVANHLAQGQHQVADMALLEFVYVLEAVYGYPRQLVAKNLEIIAAHPNISCNRELLKHVLPAYVEHPAVSFGDCCLAICAHLNNAAPLRTFDRKLANQLQHAELLKA
jgi:predicted nucleic-acid-binding protein